MLLNLSASASPPTASGNINNILQQPYDFSLACRQPHACEIVNGGALKKHRAVFRVAYLHGVFGLIIILYYWPSHGVPRPPGGACSVIIGNTETSRRDVKLIFSCCQHLQVVKGYGFISKEQTVTIPPRLFVAKLKIPYL
jgi:hypothetical protein